MSVRPATAAAPSGLTNGTTSGKKRWRDYKFNIAHYASRIGNLSTTICRMNPNTNKVFVTV